MNKAELAENYINAFASRDVGALRALFTEDVTLQDWDQSVSGIKAVLAANQVIFDAFSSIEVDIIHCHESKDTVALELEIRLVNKQQSLILIVADIIEFNFDGKIKSVRAYKC